jgi:hypothetical protein
MLLEDIILYLFCFISIISFWLLIPREKQRNAQVIFLFMQFSTIFS